MNSNIKIASIVKPIKSTLLLDPNPIGNGPIKPTTDHSVFVFFDLNAVKMLPATTRTNPINIIKTPTVINCSDILTHFKFV